VHACDIIAIWSSRFFTYKQILHTSGKHVTVSHQLVAGILRAALAVSSSASAGDCVADKKIMKMMPPILDQCCIITQAVGNHLLDRSQKSNTFALRFEINADELV
jgi:hypothetical protein